MYFNKLLFGNIYPINLLLCMFLKIFLDYATEKNIIGNVTENPMKIIYGWFAKLDSNQFVLEKEVILFYG